MNRLTITHTHTEGTAAEGTSKGDAAGPILKANGFVFRYGAWRIRGSRDRMASWRVEAAAEALRAAGFEVEVRTDDTPRPTVVVEAERAERAAARADRFAGYAANAQARSVAAGARADQLAAGIPLGQPVLVGHHSQRRHERHLERIQRHDATCVEEGKKARYWDGRADSAENSQRHRENIPTTLRRIEQLEAALRAAERRRAGRTVQPAEPTRLDHQITKLTGEIAHWKSQIAAAEKAGAKVWSQADFVKGDWAKDTGGRWHQVLRVNKKTLTVPPLFAELSGTRSLPYDKVADRRSAAEES